MVDEGYAATQILSQLHESIIEQDLSDKQKSAITEKMAVSESGGAPGILEELLAPVWLTGIITLLLKYIMKLQERRR